MQLEHCTYSDLLMRRRADWLMMRCCGLLYCITQKSRDLLPHQTHQKKLESRVYSSMEHVCHLHLPPTCAAAAIVHGTLLTVQQVLRTELVKTATFKCACHLGRDLYASQTGCSRAVLGPVSFCPIRAVSH